MRRTPSTFVSYIERHWSSSASAIGLSPRAPPALFTSSRQSGTEATKASTDAGSVTSSGMGRGADLVGQCVEAIDAPGADDDVPPSAARAGRWRRRCPSSHR